VLMAVKNLLGMSSQNVYDFFYEQKAVVWLRAACPLVFDQNQYCICPRGLFVTKAMEQTNKQREMGDTQGRSRQHSLLLLF